MNDAIRAPIVAAVPFLHAVGRLSFGADPRRSPRCRACSRAAYFASQRLILPAVVGEDEQRLAQANSLVEGTTNVTNLLGPVLAGVLIAVLGAANVMWLDAGVVRRLGRADRAVRAGRPRGARAERGRERHLGRAFATSGTIVCSRACRSPA